jgi:hypothetical protein
MPVDRRNRFDALVDLLQTLCENSPANFGTKSGEIEFAVELLCTPARVIMESATDEALHITQLVIDGRLVLGEHRLQRGVVERHRTLCDANPTASACQGNGVLLPLSSSYLLAIKAIVLELLSIKLWSSRFPNFAAK